METTVKIYPAPEGLELSNTFTVTVEGEEVSVYKTKVPPAEPIPRLTGSSPEFGFASFASFDISTSVAVKVTCLKPVQSVKMLPTSFDTVPEVDGQKIIFTLDEPKQVTVEVNGDWHESLHIFANPFEEDVPEPDDPNAVYFGPGIHELTSLTVKDNTTVYIAGGAYVRCVVDPEQEPLEVGGRMRPSPSFVLHGKNITLRGRGIIDTVSCAPLTTLWSSSLSKIREK